jgi:hypothetical protein
MLEAAEHELAIQQQQQGSRQGAKGQPAPAAAAAGEAQQVVWLQLLDMFGKETPALVSVLLSSAGAEHALHSMLQPCRPNLSPRLSALTPHFTCHGMSHRRTITQMLARKFLHYQQEERVQTGEEEGATADAGSKKGAPASLYKLAACMVQVRARAPRTMPRAAVELRADTPRGAQLTDCRTDVAQARHPSLIVRNTPNQAGGPHHAQRAAALPVPSPLSRTRTHTHTHTHSHTHTLTRTHTHTHHCPHTDATRNALQPTPPNKTTGGPHHPGGAAALPVPRARGAVGELQGSSKADDERGAQHPPRDHRPYRRRCAGCRCSPQTCTWLRRRCRTPRAPPRRLRRTQHSCRAAVTRGRNHDAPRSTATNAAALRRAAILGGKLEDLAAERGIAERDGGGGDDSELCCGVCCAGAPVDRPAWQAFSAACGAHPLPPHPTRSVRAVRGGGRGGMRGGPGGGMVGGPGGGAMIGGHMVQHGGPGGSMHGQWGGRGALPCGRGHTGATLLLVAVMHARTDASSLARPCVRHTLLGCVMAVCLARTRARPARRLWRGPGALHGRRRWRLPPTT